MFHPIPRSTSPSPTFDLSPQSGCFSSSSWASQRRLGSATSRSISFPSDLNNSFSGSASRVGRNNVSRGGETSLANQFSAIHWYNHKISEAQCQRDAYEKLSEISETELEKEMVLLSKEDQAIFLYQKHGGNGFTDYLADSEKIERLSYMY